MFFRKDVKTVTDCCRVAELRAGSHSEAWDTQLSRDPKRENFRWADLVQENLKEEKVVTTSTAF